MDDTRSGEDEATDRAELRDAGTCRFLLSADRTWVSTMAVAEHRCQAVRPAAAITLPKQRRLCLTSEHQTCATYAAAINARESRAPAGDRGIGWQWVRTTPVLDTSLGWGSTLAANLSDRRVWQVAPAIILVAALGALGLSNLGSRNDTAVGATSSPPASSPAGPTPLATASAAPTASGVPSLPPSGAPPPESTPTSAPTPTLTPPPTVAPTTAPKPSARATYTVQANDTLYGIAVQFGVSVTALKNFNGLTTNVIHAGLVLLIP